MKVIPAASVHLRSARMCKWNSWALLYLWIGGNYLLIIKSEGWKGEFGIMPAFEILQALAHGFFKLILSHDPGDEEFRDLEWVCKPWCCEGRRTLNTCMDAVNVKCEMGQDWVKRLDNGTDLITCHVWVMSSCNKLSESAWEINMVTIPGKIPLSSQPGHAVAHYIQDL